jgi:integrase
MEQDAQTTEPADMTITPRGAGGMLHLRKRVPKRFASVDDRAYVWISLKTDSPEIARQKAPVVWSEMCAAWEARLAGDTTGAEAAYEAARNLAQRRGYRFLSPSEIARLPLPEVLDRIDAVHDHRGRPMKADVGAILGAAARPKITVSAALETYWKLAAPEVAGKSPDQIRRWRNPRIKAFRNFIDVIGDKPLDEITADDMIDFTTWWGEKIEAEGLTRNSGNKDLAYLGSTWRKVNMRKRLGLVLPLDGISFGEGEAARRPPFSADWIRDRLLAPGALDGLNPDARGILLGMVNTGYRPSEGAALRRAHIHLDDETPHISIEPDGRQLKSRNSRRRIPLVGVSLAAFEAHPDGFPRYSDNSATLSATVNKFLRENGLMESPKHVFYSLRHSFESRMMKAGIDDRIRRELFGHALNRERYGEVDLAHAAELLRGIAL